MQQPTAESLSAGPDFERAIALFGEGRFAEAEALCRQSLAATPADPHVLHMLALIRADAGAPEEALVLLEQALATGVQHPSIHLAHGRVLLHLGRAGEALAPLQQSLKLDDRQPAVVALMAKSLSALGRMREAHDVLTRALELQPLDAELREASGVTYMTQGRYAEAAAEFQRALAAEPQLAEAHADLAVVYEQLNRTGDAQALLESGLARWPRQATLRFIAARLQRRAGDAVAARGALSALMSEPGLAVTLRRDIEFELGWCADAMDVTDLAVAHFQAAKQQALAIAAPPLALSQVFPRQLTSLKRFYGRLQLPAIGAPQRPMPVFLCGFPRSGTTLLDTMLGVHPALAVLEEQPGIQAVLDVYLAAGLDYADDLARLTPGLCAEMRAAHQRVCRLAGWDGARGLVDKSPFATAHLGLLQQVFPGAPVLFMARHPCDVVLSCFMNSFEINSGTVHFTALDRAVDLYCGVMELWWLYRERLPMQQLTVKYEELVVEPERELRRLLSFLGLPWVPAVLAHSRAAQERDRIPTPSYYQVSQPLYQDARDRWRRYTRHLEPHLPRLAPHIRALGYEA